MSHYSPLAMSKNLIPSVVKLQLWTGELHEYYHKALKEFLSLGNTKKRNFVLHCRNLCVWKLTKSNVPADYRNNETNSQKNTLISLPPFLLSTLAETLGFTLRSQRLPFREQQRKSKQFLSWMTLYTQLSVKGCATLPKIAITLP